MNTGSQIAIIAMAALVAAGGTWLVKGPPAKPVTFRCDPANLHDGEICLADVAGNVLWVDARTRAEWKENGLEGSILWNMDARENASAMEADAAMHIASGAGLVVVYCSSEACGTSKQIAERIRNLDLGPPVKTLHGGWDALKGLGRNPLKDSNLKK